MLFFCYDSGMSLAYRVLTGPTASGKTACLLRRARTKRLAVISADSRQVYLGMDIGTGKPVASDLEILPHHVLNLSSVLISFSVYQFIIESARALSHLEANGTEVWVCGGTGLYIRALVEGLPLRDGPRPKLREALERAIRAECAEAIVERLGLELNERTNPARVIRACEAACTGMAALDRFYLPLGLKALDWEADEQSQKQDTAYSAALAYLKRWSCAGISVLDPPVTHHQLVIEQRVRGMFSAGLLEEVRRLAAEGLADAPVVRDGIAYREALAVVRGELALEPAIELAVIRTRQYAKRQRTYFRGQGWPRFPDCKSCLASFGLD